MDLASWFFPELVATGVSGEGGCTGVGDLGGWGLGSWPLLWVSALVVPLATRPGYGCFGPGFWGAHRTLDVRGSVCGALI